MVLNNASRDIVDVGRVLGTERCVVVGNGSGDLPEIVDFLWGNGFGQRDFAILTQVAIVHDVGQFGFCSEPSVEFGAVRVPSQGRTDLERLHEVPHLVGALVSLNLTLELFHLLLELFVGGGLVGGIFEGTHGVLQDPDIEIYTVLKNSMKHFYIFIMISLFII